MQNLEKVQSVQSIKPSDILLLLDEEGSIRGWDSVLYVDSDLNYKYNPIHSKAIYDGNLNRMKNKYSIYIVKDKSFVEKYNDKKLDSAWLYFSQGYIFEEVLFGDEAGSLIKQLLWSLIKKDFTVRMDFLDLVENNEGLIRELTFQDTRENISDKGIAKLKNEISNIINKLR